MHTPRGWIALTLVAALAAACSDQAPTAPDEGTVSLEANFLNGPDVPGNGVVLRITLDDNTDFWWMYVLDEKTHLLAEAATDPNGVCEGGVLADRVIRIQVVNDFNVLVASSDWYAVAWDGSNWSGNIFNLVDYCAWTGAEGSLASGQVDFRRHWTGSAEDWMVQGQLDRTDGLGQSHLRMKLGRFWDVHPPYGFLGFKNQDVHLNPDPRN
jgi:hypothetical protein